jgi:hypothetical protein
MGVFSPLISIPFAGGVSYADQQEGEEIILIGFAAVSFLFSFANVYWLSFVSSIFISTDVVFTLVNFYSKMGSLVKNDPFAKQIASAISPSFGFAFLLFGSVMLFISAIKREKTPRRDHARMYSPSNQAATDPLRQDKLARLGEDLKKG